MIEWSDNLLSDRERTLLRRLSVFAGGFTLDGARHVCAGDGLEGFEIFEQGSLILDVSNPATRSLVWRGVAQAKINRERTPAQRDARLRDAVSSLIDKFPKS